MKLKIGCKEYEIEGKIVVFTAIAVVCVIAYLFTGGRGNESQEIKVETISIRTSQAPSNAENNRINQTSEQLQGGSQQIRIYIKGCVKNPGVYYLEKGSLIIDAIDAAGGFSKKASRDFNMVWQLKDNCMINIPRKGEKLVGKICTYALTQKSKRVKNVSDSRKGKTESSAKNTNLVNINKATKADLMTLNGVGEVIAERIIDYRKSTRFTKPEDLKNVSGIGEKTFENMKDFVCVN